MDQVKGVDCDLVGRAVIVWTGWGRAAWPLRDDDAVVASLGPKAAAAVLPLVHRLAAEVDGMDAHSRALDVATMADLAELEVHRRHPRLNDDAVRALVWCYTFDHR